MFHVWGNFIPKLKSNSDYAPAVIVVCDFRLEDKISPDAKLYHLMLFSVMFLILL